MTELGLETVIHIKLVDNIEDCDLIYDDDNVDSDIISASPTTIRNINASCTGKGPTYATSPKIIIKRVIWRETY